jgi:rubrerythrin
MTFFEHYKRELEECGWWIKDEEKFKKQVSLSKAFYNCLSVLEPEKYNKPINDYSWDSKRKPEFIAHNKSLIHKNFKDLFKEAPETREDDKITCPHCGYTDDEVWEIEENDPEWECPSCSEISAVTIEYTRTFTAIGRKPLEPEFNEAVELY